MDVAVWENVTVQITQRYVFRCIYSFKNTFLLLCIEMFGGHFFCKKRCMKTKMSSSTHKLQKPRQPTYLSLLEGTIYLHFVVIGTSKKVFLSKYIAWSGAFLTFWSECKNLTKLRNSTDGVTKIWRKCKNFWQFRLKQFRNMVRISDILIILSERNFTIILLYKEFLWSQNLY